MKDIIATFTSLRNRHYLAFDLVVMALIPTAALILRLDTGFSWNEYRDALYVYTALSMVVKLLIYYKMGLYSHLWRYASVEEVSVILIAVFLAGFVFNLLYLLILPLFPSFPDNIPRSVPAIDLLLSLSLHGGVRLISRIMSTEIRKRTTEIQTKNRVLIIGAGMSGTMIAKEMLRNPSNGLSPIGFIDDDPKKHGGVIYGIPVMGGRSAIPDVCRREKVSQILIAMPSVSGRAIRAILQITDPLKIKTKTLPSVSEMLGETIDLRHFREVRIDDLLRREPVKTDMSGVRSMLFNERVLVTGAGGSIGSEISRLVAQCRPSELFLLGHGENSIHAIHHELARLHPDLRLHTIIADIRDEERIRQLFSRHRPAFIYHAAAHKHVPLMEENFVDALTNNVLGSMVLLKNAKHIGVRNFTLISTDKAVHPRSVMGVTKRMAELALQLCANGSDLNYAAVRFGNVLGSRGSVVPLFMDQIAKGGPITITHPEMRRYFMTIPEAVQLVLQASTLKGTGEIYVLDMGQPERILDLAVDLIELSGLTPHRDIEIKFTGLRPGEKLTEELFREGEVFKKSRHSKIFTVYDPSLNHRYAAANGHHGNGDADRQFPFTTFEAYETLIRERILSIDHHDKTLTIERIREIIPDFVFWGNNPYPAESPNPAPESAHEEGLR